MPPVARSCRTISGNRGSGRRPRQRAAVDGVAVGVVVALAQRFQPEERIRVAHQARDHRFHRGGDLLAADVAATAQRIEDFRGALGHGLHRRGRMRQLVLDRDLARIFDRGQPAGFPRRRSRDRGDGAACTGPGRGDRACARPGVSRCRAGIGSAALLFSTSIQTDRQYSARRSTWAWSRIMKPCSANGVSVHGRSSRQTNMPTRNSWTWLAFLDFHARLVAALRFGGL